MSMTSAKLTRWALLVIFLLATGILAGLSATSQQAPASRVFFGTVFQGSQKVAEAIVILEYRGSEEGCPAKPFPHQMATGTDGSWGFIDSTEKPYCAGRYVIIAMKHGLCDWVFVDRQEGQIIQHDFHLHSGFCPFFPWPWGFPKEKQK